jgi:hypothetical protein
MAPGLVARMVVGLTLVLGGTIHAARRPVAVIDLSGADPARQLGGELTTALNDHPELKPLDNMEINAALLGDFGDEDAAHLARARKLEQDAEDALAQLDDAAAERSARAGMDELGSVMPTAEMLGLYADLAFAFGQAQIGLRKPNDASRAFQLAHRLDPQKTPDPMRYQPNIVDAFKVAAEKPPIKAKLVIRGDGRAWMDGIELGPAGNQYDTTEGLHLVQLTGPERETRGERVLVPSTASSAIPAAPASNELKAKRARLALLRARDPAERASAMKRLAALLGVGDAVLIMGDGDKLSVQTWRDREPGFSAIVAHRNEPASELLVPLAPPKKVEPKPEPLPELPPIVVEKRWYQKNWVRASIAGGVVATVVGAILYARRDKMLPPWDTDIKQGD